MKIRRKGFEERKMCGWRTIVFRDVRREFCRVARLDAFSIMPLEMESDVSWVCGRVYLD